MRDSFKRQIEYLRISVTDQCNLRCIYCMPESGLRPAKESDLLTPSEITRFVSSARRHGLRKVRLTGGEPLLRGDIVSIVSSIKRAGINDLSMTTNGVFLSGHASELRKAGLKRVNISLDTLDAGKYRLMTRGGDISRVWEAIEEAERAGLYPIKINVVPVRGINDGEVEEFASLTFERDYHIRFIELMPSRGNGIIRPKARVEKGEFIERVSRLGELTRLPFKGKGPSRNYRLKGAKGIIGFISPVSDCFCAYCNRLRLTSYGKIRPCLFSDEEIDVISPMRKGVSDSELDGLFLKAAAIKPPGHHLKGFQPGGTGLPSMSQIGG
ncbi:MAG: GTP 3',8-cyclase MoaA [Thermodesulfovibrionales bacterium]|nr:GTP 3',8-cyclase MoaA [Thermodesulfovibrionales bacterium]